MEVTAGDADQSEPVGPSTEPLAFAVREARAVDLDGMQTLVDECLELGFSEIMGWMRQCGNAAGPRIKAIAWPLSSRGLSTQAGHPSPR